MNATEGFEIFLAATPGLEPLLCVEAADCGFSGPIAVPGGVTVRGGWPEVWRANLVLRGTGRVLVRIGAFHAVHLAQLDRRARRLPWEAILAPGSALRVDATCERSKIWHGGAAAQRIATAAAAALGKGQAGTEPLRVLVRIVDDFCTISLDTSGAPLHQRGAKQAVGKAPLRETLAALFLRACDYGGTEPVLDPMCGSGTFVLEAAEIACGLVPGRGRSFAFERFAGFDPDGWARLREAQAARPAALTFRGFDRDAGAIASSLANAARAEVTALTEFRQQAISDFAPPGQGGPGLVMVNPPYGERIGDRAALAALYRSLGSVLRARFAGWRLGLVTSEPALAQATGLAFTATGPPVPHGPLKIRLYRADLA